MDNFEIENCLASMKILIDTRERPTEEAKKRYDSFCIPYESRKLEYGDYTYSFRLGGAEIYPEGSPVNPPVVIERKMGLVELSNCFCRERDRFQREFERAAEHQARTYLLVENASWEDVIRGNYGTHFNPKAFLASITAWVARYNIIPVFCRKSTSGKMIKEILYRELKERLERGDYDG